MSEKIHYERNSPLGMALERAWDAWVKGPCHELSCGCITVEIWDEIAPMVDPKHCEPTPKDS